MKTRSIIALSLLMLTLAACSVIATPTPEAETSTPPPASPVGESPIPPPATPTPSPPEQTSPLPEPGSSPVETPPAAIDQVLPAAKDHLAQELGLAVDEVEATSIEAVEWPDASLGCPQPGEAYAQVITPGYRVILEVNGKEYEVHTDRSGRAIVICERELEKGAAAGVTYLADELGVPADEIEVLSVEKYEWPDTSLGCPEPGKAYAQVITPGYRIMLQAQGETYEVHTDEVGKIVVLCDAEG